MKTEEKYIGTTGAQVGVQHSRTVTLQQVRPGIFNALWEEHYKPTKEQVDAILSEIAPLIARGESVSVWSIRYYENP